ncbi:MAG: AsmA family protein [Steroidobacteraceae bacterium]
MRAIAVCVGGFVALVVLVGVAVWLLVNPNDYKGRIVSAVKTSTGRELALPGAIKLSVFPWIALELGPAHLGIPPGFPNDEFLSVEHVALRVKLLPPAAQRAADRPDPDRSDGPASAEKCCWQG